MLLAREFKEATGWWPKRSDITDIDATLRDDVKLFEKWADYLYETDFKLRAFRDSRKP